MSAVVASIAAVDVTDRRQAVNHFGHHLERRHAHSEIDDGFCGQARYGGAANVLDVDGQMPAGDPGAGTRLRRELCPLWAVLDDLDDMFFKTDHGGCCGYADAGQCWTFGNIR